ncbi:MAG: YraN family protein [Candidatus Saccharimonadales bacterium]
MTNFSHGRAAEEAAAMYLERQGFRVLDRNLRTRACEIDIVATKNKTVYCVEVKYRLNDSQGSGLEYVTAAKQKQMHFAAQMWVATHNWHGDVVLSALEVSGPTYEISEFIESIA